MQINFKSIIIKIFILFILAFSTSALDAIECKDTAGIEIRKNPIPSLHFIQSSAFGLNAGEGYVQNDLILLNQAGYGLSKNIMLQAGFLPLLFIDKSASPFWLSTKWHTALRKNHAISISTSALGFPDNTPLHVILLGGYTYKNTSGQVTLGAGYSVDTRGEGANLPIIELAAQLPYKNKNVLITENYFIPISKNKQLYSFLIGWRWIGKKVHWHFYIYGGNRPEPNIYHKKNIVFPVVGLIKPFR